MQLFRQELLKALLAREEISPRLVEITQNRVHSGFLPYQREAIATDDHRARRHVAGCMVLAPIALEPLRHRRETGQVIFYGVNDHLKTYLSEQTAERERLHHRRRRHVHIIPLIV